MQFFVKFGETYFDRFVHMTHHKLRWLNGYKTDLTVNVFETPTR